MRLELDRVCEHTFVSSLLGPSSIVVDLGANVGRFAHTLISRTGCRVIATEPVPALRAEIAPSSRLFLFGVALGGSDGFALIDLAPGSCPHVVAHAPGRSAMTQQVEMVTLDTFLKRAGATRVDLLKVDIEGAELDMFESSPAATLLAIPQITVEFHDFIDTSMRTKMRVERAKRHLMQLGFTLVAFSRDNTDLLFLNKSLIKLSALEVVRLSYLTRNVRGIRRVVRRFASRC